MRKSLMVLLSMALLLMGAGCATGPVHLYGTYNCTKCAEYDSGDFQNDPPQE